MAQAISPLQTITDFFRRCKAPAPTLTFGTSEGQHACLLECCSTAWDGSPIEGGAFHGVGSKKKVAQRTAAEAALAHLISQPGWYAARDTNTRPLPESLLAALEESLTDEALERDAEVQGAVLLAQSHADGWIPLQILLTAIKRTPLQRWVRQVVPEAQRSDPPALLDLLWADLASESSPAGCLGSLELDQRQRVIRRRQIYETPPGGQAAAVLQASLELGSHAEFAAVIVPADLSESPREVRLTSGGYPLACVAEALRAPHVANVWANGLLARNAHISLSPSGSGGDNGGSRSVNDLDDELEEMLIRCFNYPTLDQRTHIAAAEQSKRSLYDHHPPSTPSTYAADGDGRFSEEPTCGVDNAPQCGSFGAQVGAGDLETNGGATVYPKPSEGGNEGVGQQLEWPWEGTTHPAAFSVIVRNGVAAEWNLRGSWVAGRAIRGDILLTRIRLRASSSIDQEGRSLQHPVVRHADYPLRHFDALAAALSPEGMYTLERRAAHLCRLPPAFRSAASWCGRKPCKLLSDICTAGVCGSSLKPTYKALQSHAIADADPENMEGGQPPLVIWEVAIPLLGGREMLTRTASCDGNHRETEECAALAMLHSLQTRHTALFNGIQRADVHELSNEDGYKGLGQMQTLGPVEVLHPGYGELRPIPLGHKVKVALTLSANAPSVVPGQLPTSFILEEHSGMQFEWGVQGVLPEVEALLASVALSGSARCPLHCELMMAATAGAGTERVLLEGTLQLRLLDVSDPHARDGPVASIFSPPLSQQRYRRIAAILHSVAAKAVLDLGCGDGKFCDHLLSEATAAHTNPADCSLPGILAEETTGVGEGREGTGGGFGGVQQIVGIDTSQSAVEQGNRRIQNVILPKMSSKCSPRAQLQVGDVCSTDPNAWGDLRSCDAAVLIEVIEHLDPGPLAALGPALLGTLQPPLLLVTTPNRNYNGVMEAVGLRPLHNGLRNRDHRFEWTPAEFQCWANAAAQQHGYSVHFEGVGTLKEEAARLLTGVWAAAATKECATQLAIFQKGGK